MAEGTTNRHRGRSSPDRARPRLPRSGLARRPRVDGVRPSWLHIHRSDDEAWHVLEGAWVPLRRSRGRRPRGHHGLRAAGVPHTYRVTVEPSRYLIFLTPRLDRLIARLHSLSDHPNCAPRSPNSTPCCGIERMHGDLDRAQRARLHRRQARPLDGGQPRGALKGGRDGVAARPPTTHPPPSGVNSLSEGRHPLMFGENEAMVSKKAPCDPRASSRQSSQPGRQKRTCSGLTIDRSPGLNSMSVKPLYLSNITAVLVGSQCIKIKPVVKGCFRHQWPAFVKEFKIQLDLQSF